MVCSSSGGVPAVQMCWHWTSALSEECNTILSNTLWVWQFYFLVYLPQLFYLNTVKRDFFLEMNLFMLQINLQNNQGSIFICHLDCCILGTPALDGSIHICRLLFSWVGFLRYSPNMIKMSLSIKVYFCQIRGNICIYHKTSKFVVTFLAFVLHVCLE